MLLSLFIVAVLTDEPAYMSARLYTLWDQRKKTVVILGTAFVCTYIPVVVLAIFTLLVYYENTIYVEPVNTCILRKRSIYITGIFGSMCAFDLFTIGFSFLNALDRPFRHYSEALSHFQRDGAIFFLCMFLLRLANMLIFLSVPTLDEFTGVL
ncbi:hypothetical protein NM688_g683 [Phlebia brevispora]|uniref:Uncharacterized protein n=1 Tax=Phlebia brevispora TaxID=194682 RepID=A0ACC1TDE7_9APHY|nr:hypothetical protein NM688_g683 [Phlebia brevispora]